MNESTVKNSSCLAIIERKPQKQGGCGGIIYQLFEWKRKLAKKKLFSKKLLPPARAKKFKGDEKMPNSKIHLIANENGGGFPSAKKGGNCGLDVVPRSEMRAPGLVARLMGLESIPAAKRDKYKKASHSYVCGDGEEESTGNCELDLEIGVVKQDSRPQKLQKTEVCERRAVTRFGAEALQIKSVLSRARKYNHHHHHHPKLASPLKSPRIPSGKSASRSSMLIGAATKILEPGLQARNKAKGCLTYPASMYPKTGIVTNCEGSRSPIIQNQPDHDFSMAKPLMGQTSCKNCGNLLDVVDCTSNVGGQPAIPPPIVSDVTTVTSAVSAQIKGRLSTPSHEQERDVVLLRSQEKLVPLVTEKEGKDNAQQTCNEHDYKRMLVPHEVQATWNSQIRSFRTLEGDASSFALKQKTQTQERTLSGEKISSGSSTSSTQVRRVSSSPSTVNGTKDFVALNRSLSGQMRTRSPTKVDSSKFDLERKPSHRQNKSLSDARSLERKRRTSNIAQVEGMTSVNSVGAKQRNLRCDALVGKRRDLVAPSFNSCNVRSKQSGQGKTVAKVNDNKINEVVSFTFNSPLKKKMGEPDEKEETSSSNERRTCFQRPSPLIVDVLGAFLEQKLKELTSQEDELATGAQSKKSTAMILRELISALSSEDLICHVGHKLNEHDSFHYEAKQERLPGTSCNGNRLSPGSVLEASFSSSSVDESSGHGFHPNSMNYSYDQLEHDTELLDSATSFNKGRIVCEILTDCVNQIPAALQSLYSFGASLTRSKLAHMKDVVLIAELVLGFDTDYTENELPQLLIYQFLFSELDTMASDTIWTDFNVAVGSLASGQRKELKGFLFDCVIEYLETNCCQYFNCGSKPWWTKLPHSLKAEMLAQVVKIEIKKWESMVGMEPDEIIEWEMSHSLGKWLDFDIEAFEAGVDIGGDIFQILVDEIVEDLLGWKQG